MTNEEMFHKLEYLKDYLYDTLDNESAEAVKQAMQIVKQLASLQGEYNAYGNNYDDYWRGVEHSINVLNYKE